jgi:hypothetical protein
MFARADANAHAAARRASPEQVALGWTILSGYDIVPLTGPGSDIKAEGARVALRVFAFAFAFAFARADCPAIGVEELLSRQNCIFSWPTSVPRTTDGALAYLQNSDARGLGIMSSVYELSATAANRLSHSFVNWVADTPIITHPIDLKLRAVRQPAFSALMELDADLLVKVSRMEPDYLEALIDTSVTLEEKLSGTGVSPVSVLDTISISATDTIFKMLDLGQGAHMQRFGSKFLRAVEAVGSPMSAGGYGSPSVDAIIIGGTPSSVMSVGSVNGADLSPLSRYQDVTPRAISFIGEAPSAEQALLVAGEGAEVLADFVSLEALPKPDADDKTEDYGEDLPPPVSDGEEVSGDELGGLAVLSPATLDKFMAALLDPTASF